MRRLVRDGHDMTTMNQVLPTFPSHTDILDINEALRSGKYYLLITRMDCGGLTMLSRILEKYYIPDNEKSDFVQKIFPFKEGITFADLLNANKEIGETPIMITRATKSKMSNEQLIAEFVPDPNNRNPIPELSMYCFVLESDMKAWRWIDNLKMALGEE